MKKNSWSFASTKMLYMPDAELREIYKGYTSEEGVNYGEECIKYKEILNGMISNCKEGQVILVYIHADFPQKREDHAIVYKDSPPHNRLMSSDDYNVVVDIDEHFKLIHHVL